MDSEALHKNNKALLAEQRPMYTETYRKTVSVLTQTNLPLLYVEVFCCLEDIMKRCLPGCNGTQRLTLLPTLTKLYKGEVKIFSKTRRKKLNPVLRLFALTGITVKDYHILQG